MSEHAHLRCAEEAQLQRPVDSAQQPPLVSDEPHRREHDPDDGRSSQDRAQQSDRSNDNHLDGIDSKLSHD